MGVITHAEVARVFRVLNPKMPQEAIDAVITDADTDNDGYIDIFEFVEWLCAQQADGKKKKQIKKLKKDKDEREATLIIGLNRQRCAKSREEGRQKEFEKEQHE